VLDNVSINCIVTKGLDWRYKEIFNRIFVHKGFIVNIKIEYAKNSRQKIVSVMGQSLSGQQFSDKDEIMVGWRGY
jgi:hypothetical protein